PQEAGVEETKLDPESDTVPVAPEPEPTPDPQADLTLQTQTQDHDREVPMLPTPESFPAQGQVSTDAPAETSSEAHAAFPSLDSNPDTSPDEAENKPTSQNKGETNIARETDPSVPRKEDIPTFDEWKKQVMEVEKEKSQSLHTSTSGSPHPTKKVQKNFKNNYASVECGAKILSANSEAKSTSAILMENMDLYMLNPCSNKIWFVIELCEPIQVKQLDIANFELFSSTPKDFLVSISDRYPTNKWVKLGTFHARDERIVQSFPLDEQLYAKYVKVELLSHFGSEHFCPLSLIRVFGTSMVEEYEEIADSQYPSERLEYLDEDYEQSKISHYQCKFNLHYQCTSPFYYKSNKNTFLNFLSFRLEPSKSEQHAAEEDSVSSDSSTSSHSSSDPHKDRQIVTLVEEEDEDEEPRLSTVTLMEEEGEEEGEKNEEEMRKEADRNQWGSQTYCPFFSSSSLSLSCIVTLPELLHRWCSARLAKERLRSLKRRQISTQTQTHPAVNTPVLTHTPPVISVPTPTPTQETLPLTEKAPELEVREKGQNECKGLDEAYTTDTTLSTHTPDSYTPELKILLEPSRTATIPPQSFSDIHSSLTQPTPTHEENLLPLAKDATQDPVSTSPLQAVSIPKTQHASSVTPTLSVSTPPLPLFSETASPIVVVPPVKDQPTQTLPTASRPEDFISPPTELPPALPSNDIHTDTFKSSADSGDSQRQNVQASQNQAEQGDSLPQTGDPHRVEDTVEEDLLSTSGNGNAQRTATDFYAELQSGGDYNGGAVNGNSVSLNGGAVHGSSQKESVFMRLNNRIKALEMNMSLSSRYLEELSQRYRKQMEEMQKAFNKTIIKLQNTSRIAEEQDQKQTESIQVLQSQLENVTKLMLNLTATVSELQREVSDRQSYLVVSLVLCLFLGLLLCLQCCRSSTASPKTNSTALPKSNHYPSPKRCFSSYDDMSLKRRVTCPLVRSKSFHLSSTEGERSSSYVHIHYTKISPPTNLCWCKPALPPSTSKEFPSFPSETSSCSSSTHSEESYTSRLAPPSPIFPAAGMCNGHGLSFPLSQPPAKSRQEKRSMKRRKSRQTELQFPHMPGGSVGSLPSLQQLMKGNKEISVGTIGVTAVTGHV
uniref:SUN domain containing ossification factor n=1 Tax=Amphilophus citrinellus TaxID=61819 RepID=A0A3Q0SB96_AMPCI